MLKHHHQIGDHTISNRLISGLSELSLQVVFPEVVLSSVLGHVHCF